MMTSLLWIFCAVFTFIDETRSITVTNDTATLETFKRLYPIDLWKSSGWFDDDFLKIINVHWLKYPPPSRTAHYALGVLYIFVMIAGCSGNILVIFMFIKCHSLRTPANILVLNLAISDLFMIAKTPVFIFNSFHFGPALGKGACDLYGFIGGLTGTVSIGSLAAIAFDRYCVVVYPLEPLRNINNVRAKLLVLLVWLYGTFFSIIPALDVGLGRYVPEGFLTSCSFDYLSKDPNHRIFIFSFFLAAWATPLTIISFCYAKILRVVIETRNISDASKSPNSKEEAKRKVELKLAVIVICVIALFFIAWTPYAVVSLLGISGHEELINPAVSMFPALFCKIASCVDPFIYVITHPKFRKEFKILICCRNSVQRRNTYKSGWTASLPENKMSKRKLSVESVEVLRLRDVPDYRSAYPTLDTVSQRVHNKTMAFPKTISKLNPAAVSVAVAAVCTTEQFERQYQTQSENEIE